jgi:2'-5' RNA ligase
VRGQIAEHARRWAFTWTSKLYAPADWHVTLHFLGNVPVERVPEIADGADVQVDPIELVLDRPEVWPGGLAVVCASEVPPALADSLWPTISINTTSETGFA